MLEEEEEADNDLFEGDIFILPNELMRSLMLFCDGKSISSLILACLASLSHRSWIRELSFKGLVDQCKLLHIKLHVGQNQRRQTLLTLLERVQNQQEPLASSSPLNRYMKVVSRLWAFVDYCRLIQVQVYGEVTLLLYPIWYGRCHLSDFYSQVAGTGNFGWTGAHVEMSTPSWYPGLHRQWKDLMVRQRSMWHAEPRRFNTVPPLGQVRGIAPEDQQILKEFARGLARWNAAGVLPVQRGGAFSSFMVSSQQARNNLIGFGTRPVDTWILHQCSVVQHHAMRPPLYCLWTNEEEEGEDGDATRDDWAFVDSIIEMMKTRAAKNVEISIPCDCSR